MTAGSRESRIIDQIHSGTRRSLYLVAGEHVLAEPVAQRIGAALASAVETEVSTHRRPAALHEVLADLRTFSLFGGGKVRVVVDSAVFSDRKAAAYLIDQAEEALPLAGVEVELSRKQRQGAARLLQVLHLFGLDSHGGAAGDVLRQLPDWVLKGGAPPRSKQRPKRRGKRQLEALFEGLEQLLEAARREDLVIRPETDVADLASIVDEGLPSGHFLVMSEAAVSLEHPLVTRLSEQGTVVEVATVASGRDGGWQGVEDLAAELESETGSRMEPRAVAELARRTLRQEPSFGGGGRTDADSTSRFAAEFRKLAGLASGGEISKALVEDVVEDRGQQDVWAIIDSVGAGKGADALARLRRLIGSASDPMQARLGFFSLLAQFCRHLTAISGMMPVVGVPAGERNYQRFKARHAPRLLSELDGSGVALLKGLHPFRLHRAYLTAGRLRPAELRELPDRVLETELQLKGESANPDAALDNLVSHLASAVRRA